MERTNRSNAETHEANALHNVELRLNSTDVFNDVNTEKLARSLETAMGFENVQISIG